MAKFEFNAGGVQSFEKTVRVRSQAVAQEAFAEIGRRIVLDAPLDTGFLLDTMEIRAKEPNYLWARPPGYKNPGARGLAIGRVNRAARTIKLGMNKGIYFVALYAQYVVLGTGNNHAPPNPFILRNVRAWPAIVRQAVARVRER